MLLSSRPIRFHLLMQSESGREASANNLSKHTTTYYAKTVVVWQPGLSRWHSLPASWYLTHALAFVSDLSREPLCEYTVGYNFYIVIVFWYVVAVSITVDCYISSITLIFSTARVCIVIWSDLVFGVGHWWRLHIYHNAALHFITG